MVIGFKGLPPPPRLAKKNKINYNSRNDDDHIETALRNLLSPNSNISSLQRSNVGNANSRNDENDIETIVRNLLSQIRMYQLYRHQILISSLKG